MERKVNVIEDIDGKKTVFIHDIIFKGKRSVKWENVEKYLKQYVGDIYTIDHRMMQFILEQIYRMSILIQIIHIF